MSSIPNTKHELERSLDLNSYSNMDYSEKFKSLISNIGNLLKNDLKDGPDNLNQSLAFAHSFNKNKFNEKEQLVIKKICNLIKMHIEHQLQQKSGDHTVVYPNTR